MKRYFILALCLVMSVVLAACGGTSSSTSSQNSSGGSNQSNQSSQSSQSEGASVTINIGHTVAEAHTYHKASLKFAELVDERTNGRVKFQIFPAGQLGNDIELLEQVMNGELDMAIVGSANFSGFNDTLDAYSLPFLIDSYDVEMKLVNSEINQEILGVLDDTLGVVGLSMFEGGLVHFGNTQHSIKSPEDLKGLRIRVVPSDLVIMTMEQFGSTPTPMVFTEIYSGLQTNVIDGVLTTLDAFVTSKFYEVINYIDLVGQNPFPGVLTINKKLFDSLSAEDQQILREAAVESAVYYLEQINDLDKEKIETLKASGVEVNALTDAEKQVFIDASAPIYDLYRSKNPLIGKFIDEVMAMKAQ